MNRVQNDGSASLGVILKLKKNRAVVMTEKLDFIELYRKPGMIRGQKVYFTSFDLCNSSLWFLNYKRLMKFASVTASVAAIFVMLFVGYRFLFSVNEYAYVDIDINPSIEMTINKNDNVLKAEALNSDGQILLNSVKLKNMELFDAVSLLLNKSKEIGFIDSDNNKVILTTSVNSDKVSEFENEDISTMISSLKEVADKSGVESQVIEVSPEERKEAIETGLSMGKYYIYNKAKDEGINITIEEVKNSSVTTLLSKVAILDNTDSVQTQNPDTEPTPEPIKPTSTQIIENTPNITATSVVTVTPVYTSASFATPTFSSLPEFTPSPVATNVTKTPFVSSKSNRPSQKTPTPKPVLSATPSPKPTITTVISNMPFPVVTTTKTPKPRVTTIKTPTPVPTIKTTLVTVPTSVPLNTPSIKTPTPIITTTPKLSPSTTPTTVPTANPTPNPTTKYTQTPTATPISTPVLTPTSTPVLTPTLTPALTPTPTSTPKTTPTLTPSPTPTTVPTATPTEKISMKLGMYNEIRDTETKEVHPRFKLINNGNTPIKLSSIKIRYYYTVDIEDKQQHFYCDWSDIGRKYVTGRLVKMDSSEENADYYLELSFDSTESLDPGSNIEIACRFGPDNTVGDGNIFYNQSNDYSFNDTAGDFISWDKATVSVSGFLLWGTEP